MYSHLGSGLDLYCASTPELYDFPKFSFKKKAFSLRPVRGRGYTFRTATPTCANEEHLFVCSASVVIIK